MNTYNLTPSEQLLLVGGGSFFGTNGIPEKDIPRLQLLDGGTGMNFEQLFGDFISYERLTGIDGAVQSNVIELFYQPDELPDDASRELYQWVYEKLKERFPSMTPPGCYPPGILLGATWNPDVVREVGEALGCEAKAYGVNVLLGTPNVNLHRDIRNGRLFEGYSEDPCLAAGLAPAIVEGVQSKGVAANVKHFAANHQETNRLNINEIIPERALHELYYPGFEACVRAGVATVMSAYNQINSVPCTENRALLHDLLREDWGFEGVVMSDWGAVYHPAQALNAGNDLAMPGPVDPSVLAAELENGNLSPEALAISAQRVAALSRQYGGAGEGEIAIEETDRAAYHAACEGIVLLKNDAVLPLAADTSLALYGEHCEYLLTCGEGSAGIHTTRNRSFVEALSKNFGEVALRENSSNSNTFVYVLSLPGQEGNDRADIDVPANAMNEVRMLLKKPEIAPMKKILILNVSAPVVLEELHEEFDAILCCFLPGMQGTVALADILSGKVNPSGKLPLTWPRRLEDMPTYLNFPGDGMQVFYGEGIFVGYRWYDTRCIAPLYPFGHGLSYTEFAIRSIAADQQEFTDQVTVTAVVANTGNCAGSTVLQLYVSDPYSTLTKPVRELKAFRKISLNPGEEKTVTITLPRHAFESYDPNLHQWIMEEGTYQIYAGFSSAELPVFCDVYANVESPYTYGAATSVKILMETPELRQIVYDYFEKEKLSWAAFLNSYEYTAQDTISLLLSRFGCSDEKQKELYTALRSVRKK